MSGESKTERAMTAEERRRLLELRPSFLFRQRRRDADRELEQGVVEVFDFEVLRAWDMNGCAPPCCPHIYLFQVGFRKYVYVESWTAFNYPHGQFPRRRIIIVRSPIGKRILSSSAEGQVVPLEDSPFDPATEYFSFSGDTECEILRAEDIPPEMWSKLAP